MAGMGRTDCMDNVDLMIRRNPGGVKFLILSGGDDSRCVQILRNGLSQ